jgi:Mg-chelatase subunit ChlD
MALGGSCGATPPPGEDRQLVALYPIDTGDQDVQLVRMAWNAPAQQEAATAFGAWVRGDAGRAALARTGLRPVGSYPPVAPLVAAFGVRPTPPSTEPVAEVRVTAAAATYASTRRPSRVLFAFDTSRSMGTLDPGGQRAAVAATAVQGGLGHLGPSDEFGLWLFPGGGGQGHVEAVPLGTLASSGSPAVQEALRDPPLTGGAPLFRAVVDGVSALAATTLRPTTPPTAGVTPPEDPVSKRALIVLTDSEDSGSGLSARDAADQIGRRGVRVIVVTLGDARCARAGLPQLVEETGGDCVDADTATGVGRVAEIVDELRGGG